MNPAGGAVRLPRHFFLRLIPIKSTLPYHINKQKFVIVLSVCSALLHMLHMAGCARTESVMPYPCHSWLEGRFRGVTTITEFLLPPDKNKSMRLTVTLGP